MVKKYNVLILVLFVIVGNLYALSNDDFIKASVHYRNGEYKKSLLLLKKIPNNFKVKDYAYFIKYKALKATKSKYLFDFLKRFPEYISKKFPYKDEVVKYYVDLLINKKKYDLAKKIAVEWLNNTDFLIFSLKLAVKFGTFKEQLKIFDKIMDIGDSNAKKTAVILLKDLFLFHQNLLKAKYAFFVINTLFDKDYYRIFKNIIFKDKLIKKSDELSYIRFRYFLKYKNYNRLLKELNSLLKGDYFFKALNLLYKDNKKEYVRVVKLLDKKIYSLSNNYKKYFIYTGIGHRLLNLKNESKLVYKFYKKAYGYALKINEKSYIENSLLRLMKFCYFNSNFKGADYFSYEFLKKIRKSKYLSNVYYLRYRLFKKYKWDYKKVERFIIKAFPDSPEAYYLKEKIENIKYKKLEDSYKKLDINKYKNERFYLLYKAGFIRDAINIVKNLENKGEIYLVLGYYRYFLSLSKREYPIFYSDIIEKYCKKYSVDKALILAIIREESRFNSHAISWAGARGLMQIMPKTYKWLVKIRNKRYTGIYTLHSADDNIENGIYYIKYLKERFKDRNDWMLYVIASYNGGIRNVRSWLKKVGYDDFLIYIPFKETKDYVYKVMKSYYIYRNKLKLRKGF